MKDTAESCKWSITSVGMDSLHVAGVWRSPERNRVFDRAPPNTSLSDMTVLQLALELQHEGFLFQVVAMRQTRSRLPAFTLQLEQRVTYLRHKASRSEFSHSFVNWLHVAIRFSQLFPLSTCGTRSTTNAFWALGLMSLTGGGGGTRSVS